MISKKNSLKNLQLLYSNKSFFYKPKSVVDGVDKNPGYNFDGAYEVKANTDLYVPFDGISTSKFQNSIYKVQTGGRATVMKDGSVRGGISRTMPFLGWVNGPFRTYLGIRNDTSWNNFFNATNRNFKSK